MFIYIYIYIHVHIQMPDSMLMCWDRFLEPCEQLLRILLVSVVELWLFGCCCNVPLQGAQDSNSSAAPIRFVRSLCLSGWALATFGALEGKSLSN